MALNDKQLEAVQAPDAKICVIASAGSGKTTTSIEAILKYQEDNPEDNISFITFTRAAAQEMSERLIARGGNSNIQCSTIHVWAREQLIYLARKYNFDVNVLDEKEQLQILTEIVNQKVNNKVKPEILQRYINGNKNMDVSDGYLRSMKAYEAKYLNYKEENDLYDFTDYPKYLLKKLELYNERIQGIDALFVDEFQDVDNEQVAIFDLVDAKKKFYIGDYRQCIYFFRGSDPEAFEKLQDFTQLELDTNYRSHQEIIDYAEAVYNNFSAKLDEDAKNLSIMNIKKCGKSTIKAARGPGSAIYHINTFGMAYQVNGGYIDSDTILKDFFKKQPWILCRTNKEVKEILNYGYTRVSTVHQAKGLEYDNVVIVNSPIDSLEDLNIAYVAITRTKDDLIVLDFIALKNFLKLKLKVKNSYF